MFLGVSLVLKRGRACFLGPCLALALRAPKADRLQLELLRCRRARDGGVVCEHYDIMPAKHFKRQLQGRGQLFEASSQQLNSDRQLEGQFELAAAKAAKQAGRAPLGVSKARALCL